VFKTEYARSLFQQAAYRHVIRLLADASSLDANQQALVAASYQRLDEHDDAVRYYRLALAQDSGNAKNWIGLGISQEHTSALEDALNSYHQAAKLGNLNARLEDFVDKRSNTLKQVLN
jgi:tetratricopeptide (TPR) repeat protein